MSAPSPPIDISTPPRFASTSPRNQASNLTSALQADKTSLSTKQDALPVPKEPSRPSSSSKMESTGSALGTSFSATASSAARPIFGAKQRSDSATGNSFMNGMSWGGISVGSWLQDDIMMGGTSPFNFQSPSFHSSSYMPKMEANFWNNLKCCDLNFHDLHELLQHFEEVHSQAPQTFPYRMSAPGSAARFGRRRSSVNANGTATQIEAMRPVNQVRGFHSVADPKPSSSAVRNQQQALDGFNRSSLSTVQDMETIGDMEMDDDDNNLSEQVAQLQQAQQALGGGSQITPLGANLSNLMHGNQAMNGSNPTTPLANQGFARQHQHNPMVSSVNTPTFAAPQLQNRATDSDFPNSSGDLDLSAANGFSSQTSIPFNSQLLQGLDTDLGNLNFGGGNDMLDLCINDPAKALFSEGGDINTHQFPHFNFSNAGDSEAARRLRQQQMAAGVNGRSKLPGEEERPFRCPVIGCEKAYKNANGLRYHEKHGHSSQKLKENPDGTFSIVDPVTSIPYPGSVGMEKEKPYRCEVCGKRYKNLNGLKYHRNHSPPCNPDFNFNNVSLPGMQQNMNSEAMF